MTLLDVVDAGAQPIRTPAARIRTCRLSLELDYGGDLDLGRVVHEAPAEEWFEQLPDLDVDGDAFVVTLWLESASARWPLDDRVIPWEIADALVENRLDELVAVARNPEIRPV